MSNAHKPINPIVLTHGDYPNELVCADKGLTKREYFAAMAMQGMLATGNLAFNDKDYDYLDAEFAVRLADALLAKLDETK